MTKDDFNAETYARQRIPVINAKMRDTTPGFILFVGDSHVDLYREPSTLCGRDTVNAGLSGTNSKVYANALERLTFPRKAALAVLTIGTNDLLRKRKPDPESYKANIERILNTLEGKADLVVATAIPPIDKQLARYFNVDAIESYSTTLAGVCARFESCIYQDPYKDLRHAEGFGLAKPGAMADGLHVKSYRDIYERLPLCRILSAAR
ncbi:SGNH/GDSL hydrolase family protein [Microvirga massiliensis]|uniref:SGNH/GDSL hydrolase family protein n=1 Tax=Microvirga massiliensis TaxID=1033741 RepID=UPI00164E8179|nr:SGNH/GDSL hydrolase family protein [Microvirga massiliensis]